MSTTFFRKYPRIDYQIDGNGSVISLTDISRAVAINSMTLPDDVSAYTYYEIQNGERPDVVSHKLYGDVQYHWTFFILNPLLKDGYAYSWPLPMAILSEMIEDEYGKYSAISTIPVDSMNGNNDLDFSAIILDDEYLPYLRLSLLDNSAWAKIQRYDQRMHQCIVYDITRPDTGTQVSRDAFVEYRGDVKTNFKLAWDDNALVKIDANDTPQTMTARNAAMKRKWLDASYLNYAKYDVDGATFVESVEYDQTLPASELETLKIQNKDSHVLNKVIRGAFNFFRWNNYAEAAYQYTLDSKVISAYDVLKKPAITTNSVVSPITINNSGSVYRLNTSFVIKLIEARLGNSNGDIITQSCSLTGSNEEYATIQYFGTSFNEGNTEKKIWFSYEHIDASNYITNVDHENMINDSKQKIKVIRPEYIRQFSEDYYEVLNS